MLWTAVVSERFTASHSGDSDTCEGSKAWKPRRTQDAGANAPLQHRPVIRLPHVGFWLRQAMNENCPSSEAAQSIDTKPDEINFPIVPEANEKYVNKKQLLDYRNHRTRFIQWLLTFGKNPEEVKGYSEDTVKRTAYRCAKFDRFAWKQGDGYRVPLTHEAADEYLKHVAYEDYSDTHRHKVLNSLKRYFRWRTVEHNESEWEPVLKFSSGGRRNPPDYFSVEERKKIRQAALDYGTIPSYNNLSPEERERWKKHVATVLRKPADKVVPADWERVNGWKYTTMVWVSLDAGLRPAEVARAKVSWVDVDNAVLRIPEEDSTKNRDNWRVSITERTAEALDRWLTERGNYERYENTNSLWLTREGNPYRSKGLRRLLVKLCDHADIDTENRSVCWYSIRHSVGTFMTREEDLAAAKAQLRHKAVQTTMKYDAAPVRDRRNALNKMG